MRNFGKKFIAVILTLSLLMSMNITTFANSNSSTLQPHEELAAKVNWWKIGWVILTDYVEKLINLDGKSKKDSTMVYMVSPSIEYNTGKTGGEVYFRPEVNKTIGNIRMHGHRIIAIDVFAKLNLILSDSSGRTVKQATTQTNQYMFYTPKSSDKFGKWKAQFVSAQSYKWQLYYAHYVSSKSRSASPEVEDGFYFADNNRVYQYSDMNANSVETYSTPPAVVDITQLNKQFINPSDGKVVDYLKDFNDGDVVNFSDTIEEISYDATEDATTFYFTESISGEKIGWKFDGNLTDEYSAGSTLNLKFKVVNVDNYKDITFESLDYFESAYSHKDGTPYPKINDYR